MIVIFSKDRAFQLEACLRTLLTQCRDADQVPIRILWTASSPAHRQAYELLQASLRDTVRAPLKFIEESSFRKDLILILADAKADSRRERFIRLLSLLGKVSFMRSPVASLLTSLVRPAAVLFVVDDTLFLRPFSFIPCARFLMSSTDRLAFSLRLGQGVTRSYMGDCEQQVPPMTPLPDDPEVFQFRWPDGDIDFEYPLEISSSILNLNLIFARLLRKKWKSPNTLEFALAKMAGRYKRDHPILLTFQDPRAISAPLNIVQQDFVENRHGIEDRYHPDTLCRLFLQGTRADLTRLHDLQPNSVHMEIDLLPASTR